MSLVQTSNYLPWYRVRQWKEIVARLGTSVFAGGSENSFLSRINDAISRSGRTI